MSNHAHIILKSNCIFTATGEPPFAGYLAISDGRLLRVEHGEVDPALIGNQTTIYELGERLVCPGFSDAHTFFTGWAMRYVGVNLSAAQNAAQLVALAQRHAETLPADAAVLGHGWSPELSVGTPADLDAAFGARPVVLFAEGAEVFWLNNAAIARYGFDNSADCNEVFWALLEEMLADHAFIKPLFRSYMQMLNSRGITMTKEIGYDTFSTFPQVLDELERDGQMTLRVNFMSQPVKEGANFAFARQMRKQFQGDFVRFSGFNRMTDGSISALCGYLKEPYLCAPDTTCAQEIDWQTIEQEVLAADADGFRFSLNAQGDAAVARVVDIYSRCQRSDDGMLTHRHAITEAEFSDPVDLERMAQLGIICEFYPQIQAIANRTDKVGMIAEKIGLERGKNYWNRRKMADYGVPLCCGTDLPLVIDNIPQSLYHTVTGCFPEGGEPFNPQNTLTPAEVLTAWTAGGAFDMYREAEFGTLVPGMGADIAVLDTNPFACPIDEVQNAGVCLTLVNGVVVHEAL